MDGCVCARHRGNAYTADKRLRSVLKRHRLDRIIFDSMWLDQGGLCYACNVPLQWETFTVDHDHRCCSVKGSNSCGNCVVGFTCKRCNTGFGMFGDDSDLMIRAATERRRRLGWVHD